MRRLSALDRADDARRQLANVGLLSKTRAAAMPHLHPLVKVEGDARKEFRAIWQALGLEYASTLDGVIGDRWKGQPGVGLPTQQASLPPGF